MAAPNGMNGAPPAYGSALLPNAGHHNDMQHVWSLVEELSGILQSNRERWDELQDSIARAQIRPTDGGGAGMVDGGDPANQAQSTETIGQLQNQLADAQKKIDTLEAAYREQGNMCSDYETGIREMLARLRAYIYEQSTANTAYHAHYTSLLTASRNETMQTQLTHQAWQASFARVSEYVRLALKEKSETSLPYKKRIATLKEENRVLRLKAGWDEMSWSGSESEDDDEEVSELQSQREGRRVLGMVAKGVEEEKRRVAQESAAKG